MIPLEKERTRFGLVAVQSASRRSRNLDVIEQLHAIADHGSVAAHEGDIERTPLSESERHARRRGIVAVDRAHLVRRLTATLGADLDLIPAAQINPAVAAFRTVDLDVQLEILKLAGGL